MESESEREAYEFMDHPRLDWLKDLTPEELRYLEQQDQKDRELGSGSMKPLRTNYSLGNLRPPKPPTRL